MADRQTLLEWLADYSHSDDIEGAPAAAWNQAALCVLDTVGCIIAGSRTPEARALFNAEQENHGDIDEWSAEVTARVLGYLGDVLELNDLIGGHSSIGVVPAVLATAGRRRVSGQQALRAVLAGTEVTARLYDSAVGRFKPYSEGGTVIVSYFNAVGAAAALSLLHGFDRARTADTMAMSATICTWCPAEVIFGQGGTVKPMLFGAIPASSAVQAVGYASHGLTGPTNLIESPIGLMRSLAEEYEPEQIRRTGHWFITTPQRKLHAACGYTHSSVDAVSQMELNAEELEEIVGIEVAVPEFFREAVGKVGAPESSNDARFHLGYAVALAVQGHYPILPEHTLNFRDYLAEGRTLEIAEKVRIVPDDPVGSGSSKPYNVSRVTVKLRDGSERVSTCLSPRGSVENPLTDDEVIEKFCRLVTPSVGTDRAEKLLRRIRELDECEDIEPLLVDLRDMVADELRSAD